MSSMSTKRVNERGAINELLLVVILLVVLFFGAASFGVWAFVSRQDYKNNSDQKVTEAVQKNTKTVQEQDAKQYAEAAKSPFATYIGPSAFGNVTVKYPKTWSAYTIEVPSSGTPIDAYFQPGQVPNISDATKSFALRVQLVAVPYDQVLNQFSGLVQAKQVTAAAYKLPKVPTVVGTRLEGQVWQTKQGSMVVLPLRNLTLKVWTESNDFRSDFDNILANLTFVP